MAWLLLDFAILAVLLRAANLAFQSLVVGGVVYVALAGLAAGPGAQAAVVRCRRGIRWAALALAIAEILYVAVDTAILLGTTGLPLSAVITADYFLSGMAAALVSLALMLTMHEPRAPVSATRFMVQSLPFVAVLVVASIWATHSVSRLDHRLVTGLLTGVHQFAASTWIGAMPFFLVSLAAVGDASCARVLARRFSGMAIASVAVLVAAGLALSYYYIGSWPPLYGTAYGVSVLTKVALLAVLLGLGAMNWWLVRTLKKPPSGDRASAAPEAVPQPLLLLRRIGEAELGIGFSIILAAASLTSQPPAVDLVEDRLSAQEIVQRFRPVVPRLTSPAYSELSPATPLEQAVGSYDISATAQAHNQDADIAWSEYSHHWAGLILLAVSLGAWLSKSPRFPWARYWPLGFIALAIFSFLRGDTENWPLGPISFWKSFYDPEVAAHRVYDLVLVLYAVFECGVQTGRLKARKAAYVFPAVFCLGGATLLLHSHTFGSVKNELLIEMNHYLLGVFAVFAGWARWLEIRLPQTQAGPARRIAAQVWPACLLLLACVLLNYREA
jgi:putative copper resistance protein D